MTDLIGFHEEHGAIFEDWAGRPVVSRYQRPEKPERTHRAVRNGVGVTDMPYEVIIVEGADRIEYVDNVLTTNVPEADGRATYAFLLNPQGQIETDLLVCNASERLLLFTPPGRAGPTVDGWEVFIQDVDLRVANDDFRIFGVHGPKATEKLASVLTGATPPDDRFSFVRGSLDAAGVTVLRTDAPTGEVGYEIIVRRDEAVDVLDILLNQGMNAVPFGWETWLGLTLEAGTPLFETELEGRIPNITGLRTAVDFEKGCFVGQELVSKVENRGRPSKRLVGLGLTASCDAGAPVVHEADSIGAVTRSVASPMLGDQIAFAYVDYTFDGETVQVRENGNNLDATVEPLPFYEGSERSGRIPTYLN